ncbi:UAA transporter [Chiua virens]|nr:UAA transporter [Chiua virens]
MLSTSDWFTTLSFVFGGCCSNAITMERLTSEHPHSGILITFFQFLIVSLYALPAQLVFQTIRPSKQHQNGGHEKPSVSIIRTSWLPRLRKRRVPLAPYLVQVALFFALSILNNAAFAFDIPMTVHIVFRSGGMIINMLLGWLLVKKQYTPRQIVSVFIVTIGIIFTTLSASKPKPTSVQPSDAVSVSRYVQGISILTLALLLSGFLGLTQDYVFTHYIQPRESPHAPNDPSAQPAPSWQENMFYIHALALPLFYYSRDNIASELARFGASPPISLLDVDTHVAFALVETLGHRAPALVLPSMYVYLAANTVTQLLCVIGVNRLTGRVSSLTVTLVLTVRKAVSLLLSVAVYGGQANAMVWSGAALVFVGTIGYSTRMQTRVKDKKD